ncbi:MAG: 23S rRNA (adenine(2503)-C(2))-methyltransferase RlmN [Candidatus Marinimicrobia bacterium]|nr:23S rRNA (adenine(2503)-C(2))-methyltransferase RlmN [Candidatus Neomarinimicrobiota bacterium]
MIRSLKNLSYEEMQQWAVDEGFAPYTGRQLFEWLFRHFLEDPAEMHNIKKEIRSRIAGYGPLRLLELLRHKNSGGSGTEKFLFQCLDGNALESVLIRSGKRVTLCVSSQIGCAMNCSFCRTADMGFIRNLSAAEIIEQFIQVKKASNEKISNVVFMGMGEPFNNFEQSIRAAIVLNHEKGPQIAARHITLSTSGIVPKIREFAHLPYQFKLAISLNASTNRVRDKLMPVNHRYPLEQLLDAAKYYSDTTRRRITFEYVLIRDVNDSEQDAAELKRLLRHIPCKLNVIPFNETGASFQRPDEKDIERFIGDLENAVFPVTLRLSGGRGINAACGQLYHEVLKT